MYWGTIHRMILVELIKIFFVALIALTGIILLAGVISEAMRNGFGPAQILACIPLLIPSLLPYTVPTTTLFSTCIVYGRLSADNEILALKAAGVHIIHVIWPALLLGLVTTIVTMVCFIDLIPLTGHLLRAGVVGDVEELMYMMLRRDGNIKHAKINWEIHVKDIQGRKLQSVIFKRKTADGSGFDIVAVAREAELRVDVARKKILVDMHQCQITQKDGTQGYVEAKIWDVEILGEWGQDGPKMRALDMTWAELVEYSQRLRVEKEEISVKIAALQAEIALGRAQPGDADTLRNLAAERKIRDDVLFAIDTEFCMRPALAVGCLCFALVACPIGIWFSKSDYLSAFITCFLPIVIIYYPLMFCLADLSRAGKIPAWMAIFDADALMLVAGAILFRRLARN